MASSTSDVRLQRQRPSGGGSRDTWNRVLLFASNGEHRTVFTPDTSTDGPPTPGQFIKLQSSHLPFVLKISCPLCSNRKAFHSVQALQGHLSSPVHAPKMFHCPLPLHLHNERHLHNEKRLHAKRNILAKWDLHAERDFHTESPYQAQTPSPTIFRLDN
jgi:hypothetical protein